MQTASTAIAGGARMAESDEPLQHHRTLRRGFLIRAALLAFNSSGCVTGFSIPMGRAFGIEKDAGP